MHFSCHLQLETPAPLAHTHSCTGDWMLPAHQGCEHNHPHRWQQEQSQVEELGHGCYWVRNRVSTLLLPAPRLHKVSKNLNTGNAPGKTFKVVTARERLSFLKYYCTGSLCIQDWNLESLWNSNISMSILLWPAEENVQLNFIYCIPFILLILLAPI